MYARTYTYEETNVTTCAVWALLTVLLGSLDGCSLCDP